MKVRVASGDFLAAARALTDRYGEFNRYLLAAEVERRISAPVHSVNPGTAGTWLRRARAAGSVETVRPPRSGVYGTPSMWRCVLASKG